MESGPALEPGGGLASITITITITSYEHEHKLKELSKEGWAVAGEGYQVARVEEELVDLLDLLGGAGPFVVPEVFAAVFDEVGAQVVFEEDALQHGDDFGEVVGVDEDGAAFAGD